jgi:site-specific recombinase XerD
MIFEVKFTMEGKIADKIPEITDEEWSLVCDFNKSITEEFLEESTQLSPETLKQYRSCLRIYFDWVRKNCDNKPNVEIKSRDFLRFQNFLTRRGLSSSAIRLKRSAISSLNNYILTYYEDEYPTFKTYITKKISAPPKSFVHQKQPLNSEEIEYLINELKNRGEWQKVAYVQFTYSTGCRRQESRQLLKEIINYQPVVKQKKVKAEDGVEFTVEIKYYLTHDIRCKGHGVVGKVRQLKFNQTAMDSVKKWLEVRGEDDCPYVFVSKYGGAINQLSEGTFNDWCKNDFSKIVGRRVHPHIYRESRATTLVVEEGKDIKVVQSLLGHESSETTEIYVIRDREEDADDAFI